MKLLPKFALLSIGVAAVLAIAGYSSIRVSQAALREAIEGHEVLLARRGYPEYVSSQLGSLRASHGGRDPHPGEYDPRGRPPPPQGGAAQVPASRLPPE